jgi:hypothetical protein
LLFAAKNKSYRSKLISVLLQKRFTAPLALLIGIFMRGYSIPLLGRATTIPKVLLKLPV